MIEELWTERVQNREAILILDDVAPGKPFAVGVHLPASTEMPKRRGRSPGTAILRSVLAPIDNM